MPFNNGKRKNSYQLCVRVCCLSFVFFFLFPVNAFIIIIFSGEGRGEGKRGGVNIFFVLLLSHQKKKKFLFSFFFFSCAEVGFKRAVAERDQGLEIDASQFMRQSRL